MVAVFLVADVQKRKKNDDQNQELMSRSMRRDNTYLNTTVLFGVAFIKLKISNTTAPKRNGMRFLQSLSHVPCLAKPWILRFSVEGIQRQLM